MQETWVWSLEGEDPQKEIATHTWDIPWTEEPGQSTESQRIRHKLATKQQPQQAAISHVSCYLTLQNCIIYLIKPILGLKCLKTLTGKAKAHILMWYNSERKVIIWNNTRVSICLPIHLYNRQLLNFCYFFPFHSTLYPQGQKKTT